MLINIKIISLAGLLLGLTRRICADPHDRMSRHLVLENVSSNANVIMIMEAATTEGPYYEEEGDYIISSDMTAAAHAGSPGVTVDRLAVLNGIPLDLTLVLYDTSYDNDIGVELEGAEVSLWHCDAAGVYSAVESAGTGGQKWLRGRQVTDANGIVNFQTILPGWYTGRTVHIHIRIRLPGDTAFIATSQLFLSNEDVNTYKTMVPYSEYDPSRITPLESDGIYNSLSSEVAALLTLNLEGSKDTGVSSRLAIGLAADEETATVSPTSMGGGGMGGPGGPPPNGTPPGGFPGESDPPQMISTPQTTAAPSAEDSGTGAIVSTAFSANEYSSAAANSLLTDVAGLVITLCAFGAGMIFV